MRPACVLCLLVQVVVGVRRFFLFSDIGYDPYFGTEQGIPCQGQRPSEWGSPECASPGFLVNSMSRDMQAAAPQFAISCGDLIENGRLNETEALNAFDFVANSTRQSTHYSRMPKPTIVTALGERDLGRSTFSEQNSSAFLENMAESLVNRSFLNHQAAASFKRCGYYSLSEIRSLRIIVLNTEVWSFGRSASPEGDPCGQLRFLQDELNAVRESDAFAVIVGHKPPGIAITAAGIEEVTPTTVRYWADSFQIQYQAIIADNSDIISFQLFGHTGFFSFIADMRISSSEKDDGLPLLMES